MLSKEIKQKLKNIKNKEDCQNFIKEIDTKLKNTFVSYTQEDVKEIFFDHLSRLDTSIFDRASIPESIAKILKRDVENSHTDQLINPSKEYVKEYRNAQYWAALGSTEKPSSGASDSFIITDPIQKKKIGIYKPASGEPLSYGNKNILKRLYRTILRVILPIFTPNISDTVLGKAYAAEVVTSLIGKKVAKMMNKESVVPETQIATFNLPGRDKEPGSFQLWVTPKTGETVQEAMDFFNTDKRYKSIDSKELKKIPQELFDIMGIITFITGDADKKGDNWLILSKEGEAVDIKLIDGGWSIHPHHITNKFAPELNYQHCWKVLPNGQVQFSEAGKELIVKLWENKDQLVDIVNEVYSKIGENKIITQDRTNLILTHLETLTYVATKGLTLEKLANVRKLKHFKQIQEELDATKESTYEFSALDKKNIVDKVTIDTLPSHSYQAMKADLNKNQGRS